MVCAMSANQLSQEIIRNRSRYIAIAAKIVSTPDQAEDIVQDAFCIACRRTGLCPDCPIRYACRIVRNLSLDRLRHDRRQMRNLASLQQDQEPPTIRETGEKRLEQMQTLRLLVDALRELPKRTRDVFLRHRVDGVPQCEIARDLNLSPARIHALIKHAHDHCDARLAAGS
jgi:RNA polymerase sigma-70 factor, ECF subfamily